MKFPRLLRFSLAALPVVWPALAGANTFYRCTDTSGNTLYTNQKSAHKNCTVLSVMVPPAPGTRPAGGTPATRTPTPADFPKVGQGEQQARDTDRRTILESEMRNEQTQLDEARKRLAEAQKLPSPPPPTLKDSVALHERNIEALKKEMAKLR
ncbi:MAG: DUF4124 domain-containing protein [Rhodocyclaceae bacterium]|jgi:hypothetical protein|nr:DUF4124 domain-containing protein [Rhodocyclaceae bacterium]MBK6909114.1 DUF4124 domain-containing protein [Rhodocyclaceae bacterium]